MNQHQFKKWQVKEGSTIYNARAQFLSTTDILAHILRERDLAVHILDNVEFDELRNITIPEITSILNSRKSHHLSDNKINIIAEQIVSSVEFGRRVNIQTSNNDAQLGNPIVARKYFRDKFSNITSYEELIVAFLSGSLRPIKWEVVFRGTIRATAVSPREILIRALKNNAESIILAHNHPGGGLEPTADDRGVTNIIKEGCKYIDIRFIDHLIVTEDSCYSIKEEREI